MIYLRYAIVFVLTALAAAFVVAGLNARFDNSLGSSAQLMVPAMIAALIEGQQHAKAEKARASSARIWSFTWSATLVAVALNLGLAYLAAPIAPVFGKLAVATPLGQQFLVLLGLYAGGYLVCNRLFFGIGQGNQLALMRSRGEIE